MGKILGQRLVLQDKVDCSANVDNSYSIHSTSVDGSLHVWEFLLQLHAISITQQRCALAVQVGQLKTSVVDVYHFDVYI